MIRQEALGVWKKREILPTYAKLLVILVKGGWKDAQDILVKLCKKE